MLAATYINRTALVHHDHRVCTRSPNACPCQRTLGVSYALRTRLQRRARWPPSSARRALIWAKIGHHLGARLGIVSKEVPVLTVADAATWSQWLTENEHESEGVWLVLAKKGTVEPTRLTYDEALEQAVRYGWVDGQLAKGDERTFRRRFTPRKPGSGWSKRNVALADRLASEGRMLPGGMAAVERAKEDGSWDRAYESQRAMTVPSDLAAALAANAPALAMFEKLDASNRYAVLYRVTTAKRAETRRRRIELFVAMLARGETIHPRSRQARPD